MTISHVFLFLSFLVTTITCVTYDIYPPLSQRSPQLLFRIGTLDLNPTLLKSHHTQQYSNSHDIQIGNIRTTLQTPQQINIRRKQHVMDNAHEGKVNNQTDSQESSLWIITLKTPILSSTLTLISSAIHPYTIGSYLPHNSYMIHAPASHLISLTPDTIPGLLYVHAYHPVCKIEPELKNRLLTYLTRRAELQHDPTVNSTHAMLRITWGWDAKSHQLSRTLHEWHRVWKRESMDMTHHGTLLRHIISYTYTIVDGSQLRIIIPRDDIFRMSEIPTLLSNIYDIRSSGHVMTSTVDMLLSMLLSHPSLLWIESENLFTIHNRFSRLVVQGAPDTMNDDPSSTLLYSNNITGAGEIIAIGDTGVDYDNCFFWDPEHPIVPGQYWNGNSVVDNPDKGHRKIRTYVTSPEQRSGHLGAPGDFVGHGTHTAGTLAGQAVHTTPEKNNQQEQIDIIQKYNGLAYDARLAIYDFQNEGEDSLFLPNLIYEEYFKPARETEARICSNSWGDDSGEYDSYTRDVDRFMVDHPDFLAVFAAGNNGQQSPNAGLMSLSTPAVAKNVLTVGSCFNSAQSFSDLGYNAGVKIEGQGLNGIYFVTTAQYGPTYSLISPQVTLPAILADPIDACTPWTDPSKYAGHVVVARRGTCTFVTKSSNIQQANGTMMLLVTSTDDGGVPVIMYPGDNPPDVNLFRGIQIPSIMIGRDIGENLISALQSQSHSPMMITFPTTQGQDLNEKHMSDFSSRGPTKDGRIKPDILTPGEHIQSAKSDKNLKTYQCTNKQSNVEIMEGTSMATPAAAASAALVRQYLREGNFYFENNERIQFDAPSSALLKAILIQSAQALGGIVVGAKDATGSQFAVTPPPSYFQGHGRLSLDTVLPFPNSSFVTILRDMDESRKFTRSGQSKMECIQLDSSITTNLRATLVWLDPAGTPGLAMLLVNNLDLGIAGPMKTATGVTPNTAWMGNNNVHDYTSSLRSDGPQGQWDTSNNVEKIDIPKEQLVPGGNYRIIVRATTLGQLNQEYALVITGNFQHQSNCPVSCPNDCSGHGNCQMDNNQGMCTCDTHWAGADCSHQTIAIPVDGTPIELTSHVNQWTYYHFDSNGQEHSMVWRLQSNGKGDPDFYLARDHTPTLSDFILSNTECDSCGTTDHTMTLPAKDVPPQLMTTPGTWILGVWGYCCRDTWVKIWIQVDPKPTIGPPTEPPTLPPPTRPPKPYNFSDWAVHLKLTFDTPKNLTNITSSLCTIIDPCTRILYRYISNTANTTTYHYDILPNDADLEDGSPQDNLAMIANISTIYPLSSNDTSMYQVWWCNHIWIDTPCVIPTTIVPTTIPPITSLPPTYAPGQTVYEMLAFHITFTFNQTIDVHDLMSKLCAMIPLLPNCDRLRFMGSFPLAPPSTSVSYQFNLLPVPANRIDDVSIPDQNLEVIRDRWILKIYGSDLIPFVYADISVPASATTYPVYWCGEEWRAVTCYNAASEPTVIGLNRNFLIASMLGIGAILLTVICCIWIHRKRVQDATGGAHHRVVSSLPATLPTRVSRAASQPKRFSPVKNPAIPTTSPQEDVNLSDAEGMSDNENQTFVVGGGEEVMSESDMEQPPMGHEVIPVDIQE